MNKDSSIHNMDIQEFTTDGRGASNAFAAVFGLLFLCLAPILTWLYFAERNSEAHKALLLVVIAVVAAVIGAGLLYVSWIVRSQRVTVTATAIEIVDRKGRKILPWNEYATFKNDGGKLVLYDVSGEKRLSFPSSIKRINEVLPLLVDFEIRRHRNQVDQLLATLPVPYVSTARSRIILGLAVAAFLWWYTSTEGLPIIFSIVMAMLVLAWLWIGASPWIRISPLSLEYMNPIFKKTVDMKDMRDVRIAYSKRVNEVSQTGEWDKRLVVVCKDGREISIHVDDHPWMEIYLLLCKLTGKLDRIGGV